MSRIESAKRLFQIFRRGRNCRYESLWIIEACGWEDSIRPSTQPAQKGGEPDPRHLQKIAVAASFRTWPGSLPCNAGRPAVKLKEKIKKHNLRKLRNCAYP